jgi:hypothetical protein
MRLIRSRYDHEPDGIDGQQFVNTSGNSSVGIDGCGFIARTLQNGRQAQAFDCADHWRMKAAPRQSESYQPNINHSSCSASFRTQGKAVYHRRST